MKRKKNSFVIVLIAFGFLPLTGQAQPRGTNVFSTSFNRTATGRNDLNAYLMCYLNTLIYPQYLQMAAGIADENYEKTLHTNPTIFKREYSKYTSFLFADPVYDFVTESNGVGYDPEAMVISTSNTIYVVFRGTDRVGTTTDPFLYDWGEWIQTDFDLRPQTLTGTMQGKVMYGFWQSLGYNDFKGKLLAKIQERGGSTKKVWISGHSLGSAQAQIFSYYLSATGGITPQALYAYAAPHPGDQQFVNNLNNILPGGRLQRFDFITDPITMLAPYSLGYRRAGVRVYYNDINTISYGEAERGPAEGINLIPAIAGAANSFLEGIINGTSNSKFKIDVNNLLGGSPFCYHHPLWYLRAAFSQLSDAQKELVPRPLAIPTSSMEACDMLTVNRGVSSNPLKQGQLMINPGLRTAAGLIKLATDTAKVIVGNAIEEIRFAAGTIIDNVTGNAIDEGDYYIRAYPSTTEIGLKASSTANESSVRLKSSPQKVRVKKFGTIGYIIRTGTVTETNWLQQQETKECVLDCDAWDLADEGSTTVQVYRRNDISGTNLNQRWLFIKVGNGLYIIKSLANGKVLDANNDKINTGDCGVKTYPPLTDDLTQVWRLEKAN